MDLTDLQFSWPVNEPVRDYAPGSQEREALRRELVRQQSHPVEVPLVIGGRDVRTGSPRPIRCPHDHERVLGRYHAATAEEARLAVRAALEAKPAWQETPWEDRSAIFLRAAELLSNRYRHRLVAATMLGQSKSVFQAELDAACELIDYLRFNVAFARKIYGEQMAHQAEGTRTRMEYRPLEGFVFAVTPFNFTAIAGNLPTAPALLGNTVVWKPAGTAVLNAFHLMSLFREAGLPDGVINLVPGDGGTVADPLIDHRDFAGLHFTGSTDVFNRLWKRIGENVGRGLYRTYPRLVGETGGKDFVIAYKDADVEALSVALFRGAFEYQGQKCSATSRAYIPASLWSRVKSRLAQMADEVRVGDVADFSTFMGAVIDGKSYDNIVGYLEAARTAPDARIVIGGERDNSRGFFIRPTVIETDNPGFKTMEEEIFGPLLTVYVYRDDQFEETLGLIDSTSPYALTGAVFSEDRSIIRKACRALVHAAGNFYINDKTTGAVVGQQPFGGARMSGTNDKAGSHLNLLRWVSPRTVKENFAPPLAYAYAHMIPDPSPDLAKNDPEGNEPA
jgi:1-pyrroline-5-carboxylate dehydrogenase